MAGGAEAASAGALKKTNASGTAGDLAKITLAM